MWRGVLLLASATLVSSDLLTVSQPGIALENTTSDAVFGAGTDLELGHIGGTPLVVALRFSALSLLPTDAINSASIQFSAHSTSDPGSGALALRIFAEKSTDSAAFSATPASLTTRNLTAAFTKWEPGAWSPNDSGFEQQTVDLGGLISEVTGLAGWASGDALTLIFFVDPSNTGTAQRIANTGPEIKLAIRFNEDEGGLLDDPLGSAERAVRDNVIISLSVLGALLLVVAYLICWRCKRKRDRDGETGGRQMSKKALPMSSLGWEVDDSQLVMSSAVGDSRYGPVYLGTARNLPTDPGESMVVIRVLSKTASKQDALDFKQEIITLKELSRPPHANVMRLLAVVRGGKKMVVEHCERGSLAANLRHMRDEEAMSVKPSAYKKWQFMVDACRGMDFVASQGIVHRELTASNCYVTRDDRVKIGGFRYAVAGPVKEHKKACEAIAFRWMAPECLKDGRFTSASDVWALGVLVWEITTNARKPYAEWDRDTLAEQLVSGFRLPQPMGCVDDLYTVMLQCWDDVDDRPTWGQVFQMLEGLEVMFQPEGAYEQPAQNLLASPDNPRPGHVLSARSPSPSPSVDASRELANVRAQEKRAARGPRSVETSLTMRKKAAHANLRRGLSRQVHMGKTAQQDKLFDGSAAFKGHQAISSFDSDVHSDHGMEGKVPEQVVNDLRIRTRTETQWDLPESLVVKRAQAASLAPNRRKNALLDGGGELV